jgi:hypothetical protein
VDKHYVLRFLLIYILFGLLVELICGNSFEYREL